MKIRAEQKFEEGSPAAASGLDWLITIVVLAAFAAIPFYLLSRGYLPDDDALRHAAKAISGKTWAEILVQRPDITIDHNPGWHQVLRAAFLAFGWDARALVGASVAGLFILVAAAPLAHLRRPETWAAALGLLALVFPYLPERLMIGRPLLLTMAVTLLVLSLWTRPGTRPFSKGVFLLTTGLLALSTWIHGSWYLLVLLPVAFLLAAKWREAGALAFCWLAGAIAGAALTGRPAAFLIESARIPLLAFGQEVPPEALVREFEPFSGSYPAWVIIGALLLVKKINGLPSAGWWRDPVLWLALLGTVLGFRVVRFWLDWGLPALALWTARELSALSSLFVRTLPQRMGAAALSAAVLFGAVTADRSGRWSQYGKFECLSGRDPQLAGWMPEEGGILYAVELSYFYRTFFCNPQEPWRYALGFEATFMEPENFAVYVKLCQTRNALEACAPWVAKMRPADRLFLTSPPRVRPAFSQLEWHHAAASTWIGRLPRPAEQN